MGDGENNDRVQERDFPGLVGASCRSLDLPDEAATRALGDWIGNALQAGDFVGLIGDLGAGKTTLMQGLVAAVDCDGEWEATSPTYSLIQVYETAPPIAHVDLYRLEGWTELESIGYWDYVEDRRHVACVEWLDRIVDAWPGRGLIVELDRTPRGRGVILWPDQDWASRLRDLDDHLPNSDAYEGSNGT